MTSLEAVSVLVTGATGFIGSHLAERLVAEGAEVTLAVEPRASKANIVSILDRVRVHEVDLRDGQTVWQLVRKCQPSRIYHLAAVGVTEPGIDPRLAVQVNVMGTLNLLDALTETDCDCFVNTGTCYEYGHHTPPPPAPPNFGGLGGQVDNLHFATTLDEAAELAVRLARDEERVTRNEGEETRDRGRFAQGQRYLRGLFSGGTLAYESLLILQGYLPGVYSNAPLNKDYRLANSLVSQEHTIVDLGEDEFTVGRLHPMLDNDLRIRRLQQEADDPEVAVILLDVVLGYGAHPNPAIELAPAIAQARAKARQAGRHLEVVAVVVGTDEDPQDMDAQVQQLEDAGARVETSNEAAVRHVGRLLQSLNPKPETPSPKPVNLAVLHEPLAAINVGLESFTESLMAQDAPVIQVDWSPPAGGNEKLMAILERMKG